MHRLYINVTLIQTHSKEEILPNRKRVFVCMIVFPLLEEVVVSHLTNCHPCVTGS